LSKTQTTIQREEESSYVIVSENAKMNIIDNVFKNGEFQIKKMMDDVGKDEQLNKADAEEKEKISEKANAEIQSSNVCRFCFEKENSSKLSALSIKNVLISPCHCQGSVKYIHQNCLKTWIEKNNKASSIVESAVCELCKFKYILQINQEKIFSKEKCNKLFTRYMMLLFGVITILFLYCFSTYIIISK
jgi:E3 ubiquitin-protein ligase DOA10